MEKLSYALLLAGALKFVIRSDFLERLDGVYYFYMGSVLYLAGNLEVARVETTVLLVCFFSLILFLYASLLLPFISGIKNRNTEDLDDLRD